MAINYITVRSGDEIMTHFPHPTGEYATLCGLDGNDPGGMVDQETIATPKGERVNCSDCIVMFDVIKRYREKDIKRA